MQNQPGMPITGGGWEEQWGGNIRETCTENPSERNLRRMLYSVPELNNVSAEKKYRGDSLLSKQARGGELEEGLK